MKLNQKIRGQIANAVLEHAYSAKLMTLALKRQANAYRVYDMIVDQEKLGEIASLGEPWVTHGGTQFRVSGYGNTVGFQFSGDTGKRQPTAMTDIFGAGRVGWWSDRPDVTRKVLLPNTPWPTFAVNEVAQFTDINENDCDELNEMAKDMKSRYYEIVAMVDKFPSTEKLFAAWPEIKDVVPTSIYQKDVVKLPAPRELNASLGLPKK